jgi:hypothetical protein
LSDREVTSLKNGMGMGYALAAELNQYPGPMYVLEMASDLELSALQRQLTEQLLTTHTQNVALIQAKLRASHLVTHLKQTALLSKDQITRYQNLRGY